MLARPSRSNLSSAFATASPKVFSPLSPTPVSPFVTLPFFPYLTDISYRHFLFSQAISLLELRDGITPPLTHVRNATASLVHVLDEANIKQTNKHKRALTLMT